MKLFIMLFLATLNLVVGSDSAYGAVIYLYRYSDIGSYSANLNLPWFDITSTSLTDPFNETRSAASARGNYLVEQQSILGTTGFSLSATESGQLNTGDFLY